MEIVSVRGVMKVSKSTTAEFWIQK